MVRRVITGNNAAGKSCIVSDEIVDDMTLWESLPGLPLGIGTDGAPPPASNRRLAAANASSSA